MLSVAWLDPVATRTMARWVHRAWWPRSGTMKKITSVAIMRSDTRPIGGLLEVAGWTIVVDAWFNWPATAVTADVTTGGGNAVVINWRPSLPERHNPTTIAVLSDGLVDALVATDSWPGWTGFGRDVGRLAAAASGIPRTGADPRAIALTIAGRVTGVPLDELLVSAPLHWVHLRER